MCSSFIPALPNPTGKCTLINHQFKMEKVTRAYFNHFTSPVIPSLLRFGRTASNSLSTTLSSPPVPVRRRNGATDFPCACVFVTSLALTFNRKSKIGEFIHGCMLRGAKGASLVCCVTLSFKSYPSSIFLP